MTEITGRVVNVEEVQTDDGPVVVYTIACPVCSDHVRVSDGGDGKCRCGFAWQVEVRAVGVMPPTLEEIHAMKLKPPGGMTVEEYIDDLRGDD
jgi:hypothetical protein